MAQVSKGCVIDGPIGTWCVPLGELTSDSRDTTSAARRVNSRIRGPCRGSTSPPRWRGQTSSVEPRGLWTPAPCLKNPTAVARQDRPRPTEFGSRARKRRRRDQESPSRTSLRRRRSHKWRCPARRLASGGTSVRRSERGGEEEKKSFAVPSDFKFQISNLRFEI